MTIGRKSLACVVGLVLWAGPGPADWVYKKDGGKVQGEIDLAESDESTLVIRSKAGVISIDRQDVARIESSRDLQAEYEAKKKETPAEAQAQFELALWCADRKLSEPYKFHLGEVLKLDPNHPQARKRLGYVERQGEWLTEDEAKSKDGYVKYRGKWMLLQEREQAEKDRSKDSRRQDFGRRIRLAQKALKQADKPDRVKAAREDLLTMKDPVAIPLLMNLMGKKGSSEDRRVLVDVLSGIEGEESTESLVEIVLDDASFENRSAATTALVPRKAAPLVGKLVGHLKSNNNLHVRHAAEALRELGDTSVVPSLVEALETQHQRVYDPSFEEKLAGISGTSIKPTETVILPDGTVIRRNLLQGQTLEQSFAPNVPQRRVIVETKRNEEVLDTLSALTGENFGFDKGAWRQWLARKYRNEAAGEKEGRRP